MATKNITTKSGKTIKVELVREVKDKIAYADGENLVIGREIIEFQNIYFFDGTKCIASGNEIRPLSGSNAQKMAAQGAVARIGTAAVTQEVVDLINAAFAELDTENPKSDEYLAIKRAEADALARWEANEPWRREHEEFARKMERADSDY